MGGNTRLITVSPVLLNISAQVVSPNTNLANRWDGWKDVQGPLHLACAARPLLPRQPSLKLPDSRDWLM